MLTIPYERRKRVIAKSAGTSPLRQHSSRMRRWLLKSEPDVFSFDDLKRRPGRIEPWNGVRNYQVRNYMRDDMKPGDLGFLYHSSCEVPGVAGVVRIASPARPDPTQFDPKSEYFDKGSKRAEPRWLLVDVAWEADLARFVTLEKMRNEPRLAELLVLRRGNRLSITPVSKRDFDLICRMGGMKAARRKGSRHKGTKAQRHKGTKAAGTMAQKAQRQRGTKAQRHKGTKAQRHKGNEAQRHKGSRHEGSRHKGSRHKGSRHEGTKA